MNKKVTTKKEFGSYSVTGPTKLNLKLMDSVNIKTFFHEGFSFRGNRYSVIYQGAIRNSKNTLVRVSSNCQWSFYFDNQYCDCKWQLEKAKELISQEGLGIIIFAHDQHGKSIGIEDHWKIYSEGQKMGCELVVDAYTKLGYKGDKGDYREYDDIAEILKHYGLKSIRFLTNSPQRVQKIKTHKFKVKQISLQQPINDYLKEEYITKRNKLGHLLLLK